MSDFARLDGAALDAHITGNYGEDQATAMATNQIWQHRTFGERYVVTVDEDGHAIGAAGPLDDSEIKLDLMPWYETEAADAADFHGERENEYRILSDREIADIEMRADENRGR